MFGRFWYVGFVMVWDWFYIEGSALYESRQFYITVYLTHRGQYEKDTVVFVFSGHVACE